MQCIPNRARECSTKTEREREVQRLINSLTNKVSVQNGVTVLVTILALHSLVIPNLPGLMLCVQVIDVQALQFCSNQCVH